MYRLSRIFRVFAHSFGWQILPCGMAQRRAPHPQAPHVPPRGTVKPPTLAPGEGSWGISPQDIPIVLGKSQYNNYIIIIYYMYITLYTMINDNTLHHNYN